MSKNKKTKHSVYNLNYHIVFVTKYRHKVLSGDIETYVKERIRDICEQYQWEQLALEVMPEHIHLFVSSPSKVAPLTIATTIKSILTVDVFKTFKSLLEKRSMPAFNIDHSPFFDKNLYSTLSLCLALSCRCCLLGLIIMEFSFMFPEVGAASFLFNKSNGGKTYSPLAAGFFISAFSAPSSPFLNKVILLFAGLAICFSCQFSSKGKCCNKCKDLGWLHEDAWNGIPESKRKELAK